MEPRGRWLLWRANESNDAGEIIVDRSLPAANSGTSTAIVSASAADELTTPWICQNDQDRAGIPVTDKMEVSGSQIVLTGNEQNVLRGVNFRAFFKTTSNTYNDNGPNSANYLSQHAYRQPMLDRAVAWRANVVRFQVRRIPRRTWSAINRS